MGVDATGQQVRGKDLATDIRDLAGHLSSQGIFLVHYTDLGTAEDYPDNAVGPAVPGPSQPLPHPGLTRRQGFILLVLLLMGLYAPWVLLAPKPRVAKFHTQLSAVAAARTREEVEKLLPRRLPSSDPYRGRYVAAGGKVVSVQYDPRSEVNDPRIRVVGLPEVEILKPAEKLNGN